MPDPGAEARLAQLEERWRRDPGSRIFLQLAEELRRSGRLSRAVEVLREGLVLHPHYPSALVALGRNLIENGEPKEAAEVLERALAQDPTQLVATKLAVEAHLQNGSSAEARARLDLYRLFNDRDDEITDLDRRLAELERDFRQGAEPEAPAVRAASVPVEPPSAAEEEAPFDWTPALTTAELDFSPEPRLRVGRDAAPFGSLAFLGAEIRFAEACRREGIFPVAVAAPPPPAIVETAAPERERGPGWAAAPIEEPPVAEEAVEAFRTLGTLAPPADAGARMPDTAPPPTEPPSPAPDVQGPEAIPPPWGRRSRMEELEREESAFTTPFSPREIGAEVERETIEEPFDEVFAAGPAPPRLPDVSAPPPASATLGRLYLEQGHLEEAERTFRAVLEQRPDDSVAARGLEEVVRRRAAAPEGEGEDTAAGWSATAAAAARPLSSLTQRKVETLRGYLRRIRQGAKARVS